MADYLGIRPASSVVRFSFTTHAATGAPVAPSSAFEAADLMIYKDGSATQRASSAGITMTSPFDSITGLHHIDIDLSNDTDAGFYTAGSFYEVHLVPDETVDSLAVTKVLCYFDIGVPVANVTQFGGTAGTFSGGRPEVNTTHISGDSAAADALELAFDNTAGPVPELGIIDRGTAQSATATTLVLRSAAAFANDEIVGATIIITGGSAGVGQARQITDYVSASDTATVDTWTTTPSGTITYTIFGSASATSIVALLTSIASDIAALENLSAAEVNTQMLDVLNTDTFAEPTGVPAATITLATKIGWLYMALRNGITVTATKKQFLDDGGAAEWEKDLSDDGTTYTETEGNAP